jgi:hypothetical protein
MTYAESSHLGRAINLCVARCRQSSEPYAELSAFVGALRAGGVGETYIQSINHAALRDIASMITGKGGGNYCHIVR